MSLIVYGDITSPECYLASRRVDALLSVGVEVQWCAVDAQSRLDVLARRLSLAEQDELTARFATLTALLRPGEELPWAMPAILPSGEASVSAYAEAVGAGVGEDVRRLLFDLYWLDGADVGDPGVLRTPLTGPILRGHSTAYPLRESGYAVSVDGGPITTSAYRRVRAWRAQWQKLCGLPLPVLLAGVARPSGLDAVRELGKELCNVGVIATPLSLDNPRLYSPETVRPPAGWVSEVGGRWRRTRISGAA